MEKDRSLSQKDYWKITRDVANFFGLENQIIVAIEEMSELQKELCKYKRKSGNIEHIAEEIADVLNVIDSVVLLLQCGAKVKKWRYRKIKRTWLRMETQKERIRECLRSAK